MSAPSPANDDDRTIGSAGASIPAPIGNALAPGTRMDEFEIIKVLGEGGFGIVYLAWDHSLQRQVAIKEYMPTTLAARTRLLEVSVRSQRHAETFAAGMKSFVNEARLLAQFDHPSLLKVYRFWEAHGTAYMVMPYYAGTTLRDTLSALGRPADEAFLMRLLDPLLDTLRVIHRVQCYHRDIAPDNILMLEGGRPLLLDFGAARRVIGDMTSTMTAILKPGYAPVEQYGELPDLRQGAWTDLYALGSVVYYAIVGRTPQQALPRYLNDKLEPLAHTHAGRYSDRFLRAIDAALRVHPRDRPQNVEQMRALLGMDEAPLAGAGDEPKTAVPVRAPRRVPAVLALSSAAVLAFVVAGVYVFDGWAPRVAANDAQPVTPAPSASLLQVSSEAAPPAAAVPVPAPVSVPAHAPVPAPVAELPGPAAEAAPPITEAPAIVPSAAAASPAPVAPVDAEEPPAALPRQPVETPARRATRPPAGAPSTRAAAGTPVEPAGRIRKTTDALERCRGIIQRASLGEPLEPEETTFLKQECKK